MIKEILRTVEKYDLFRQHSHIVLGLSGGPDSMCLFDVLCRLAQEMDLKIYPVHVNHRLRPGEAEKDQAYVENICEMRGFPCRTFLYDCNRIAKEGGLTSEEAGRLVRYGSFSRVAEELKKQGIARDQCETILFRLIRGTGVDGISGIAYKRYDEKGNSVIRPLLDISREQIEEYCRIRNLNPRRDQTNEEPIYSRNKIRLELIPYIRESLNPNIMEAISRLGKSAAMDRDYLQRQAEIAFEEAVAFGEAGAAERTEKTLSLSTQQLKKLHPSIRRRVYNKALETVGLFGNIAAAHLEAADHILESESPSAELCLPEGFRIFKEYDRLCFGRQASSTVPSPQENAFCVSAMTGKQWREKKKEGGTASAIFSLKKLEDAYGKGAAARIRFRGRQPGDFMVIRTGGHLHRKKLQDILVDQKIPKNQRDQVILGTIGQEVLWILPHKNVWKGRFSANYKAETEENDCIIALEYLVHI